MTKTELKSKLVNTGLVETNEYFKKYVDLIYDNRLNKFDFLTSQCHHIVPRFYFRVSNQKVDNSKSNLVNLKYNDHLMAHYYLCLCSATDEFFYANYRALRIVIATLPKRRPQDLGKQEKQITEYLDKIQKIYEKSRTFIKNRDILFYEKVNKLRSEGKTPEQIAAEFGITTGGVSSKYHNICVRNNLIKRTDNPEWWDVDIDYYNKINQFAKDGIFADTISKKINKSKQVILNKYNRICKKLKLENIYSSKYAKFKKQAEIKYVRDCERKGKIGSKYYYYMQKHNIAAPAFRRGPWDVVKKKEREKQKKEFQKRELQPYSSRKNISSKGKFWIFIAIVTVISLIICFALILGAH